MTQSIRNIIFDLGGVLIDWNARRLYNEVFGGNEAKTDWFLGEICTSDWNEQQDAGRSLKEGTEHLVGKFPEQEQLIRMYYDNWSEMFGGSIAGSVSILNELKNRDQHRLYALTNWSAETFPWARTQFDFLKIFEGIVVSGEEKTKKPQEDIYRILIHTYELDPLESIFIDDNLNNVETARKIGMKGIHFSGAPQLRIQLREHGVDLKL